MEKTPSQTVYITTSLIERSKAFCPPEIKADKTLSGLTKISIVIDKITIKPKIIFILKVYEIKV
ncbi:MAG: hypothetical protein MJ066_00925 [Clostridia bacterium]|nr:hypothetical protein [Clostridia bacterium]